MTDRSTLYLGFQNIMFARAGEPITVDLLLLRLCLYLYNA